MLNELQSLGKFKVPPELFANPIGYLWKQILCLRKDIDDKVTTVVTQNSNTVNFSGLGTEDSPLSAEAIGTGEGDTSITFTYTQSGNGLNTAFFIPYPAEITSMPAFADASPASEDAADIWYKVKGETGITIYYEVAPQIGTNNVVFECSVKQ